MLGNRRYFGHMGHWTRHVDAPSRLLRTLPALFVKLQGCRTLKPLAYMPWLVFEFRLRFREPDASDVHSPPGLGFVS
ncbi:hypothetical protein Hypma_003129 [Hypsizygus marmoreus]|uniref:Uncharacterized protein n=1 Tax=Hypsizygus marmoreus TaxID=39966 RepID=A0A369J2F8_HYPMA|nr:hypothetical protein Hypma_003129 [Hypsizygus marmoreus]